MKIETDKQYIWCLIVIQKSTSMKRKKAKKKAKKLFAAWQL